MFLAVGSLTVSNLFVHHPDDSSDDGHEKDDHDYDSQREDQMWLLEIPTPRPKPQNAPSP